MAKDEKDVVHCLLVFENLHPDLHAPLSAVMNSTKMKKLPPNVTDTWGLRGERLCLWESISLGVLKPSIKCLWHYSDWFQDGSFSLHRVTLVIAKWNNHHGASKLKVRKDDLHCDKKVPIAGDEDPLTPRFFCILKAVCQGPSLFLQVVNSAAMGHSKIGHLCFPAKGPVVNVASKPRAGPHPEQIWP